MSAINIMIRHLVSRGYVTQDAYNASRYFYHRTRRLTVYFSDLYLSFRDMAWNGKNNNSYWSLSAQLIFNYHKLEKGMCLPCKKRFFGREPALHVIDLIKRWKSSGFSSSDSIFLGAIETLQAYRDWLHKNGYETAELDRRCMAIDIDVERQNSNSIDVRTPMPIQRMDCMVTYDNLYNLATIRRSVRAYSDTPVSPEIIIKAVELAQLSPSACNRQPCRVHVYDDREKIDTLLSLQNGNKGFGHTIPILVAITAEATCFFDSSERFEPYIDSGLFVMSFLYALQTQGISTCCLNWCVEQWNDKAAHHSGRIPDSERIVMFVAAGYPETSAMVPRSVRRDLSTVIERH